MLVLKCFATNAQFIDNTANEVAVFGEMSTDAATYSRDIGHYESTAAPGMMLHSFFCQLDGVAQQVPQALVDHVLTVVKYVYDQTLNTAGEIYSDVLLTNLLNNFSAVAEAFTCGQILTNGTYYVPEWLAWDVTNVGGIGANSLRVWFSDNSFKLQYDSYEIVVVPPTNTLDDFFKTGTEVGLMLNSITISSMVASMQAARGSNPPTIMSDVTYNYIDPFLPSHIVPSNWGLLIYGAAGNNVDSISDALINFILANSSHSEADWTNILPDLFKRTEFLLIPSWFQYAISPRLTQPGGEYSPVLSMGQISSRIQALAPTYTSDHINQNATTMGHPYASLSIIAIGSPNNRDAMYQITDVYPDYLSVPTSSTDFNRMAQTTKDWLSTLQNQLVAAESMTEFSSVPQGMTRTVRNGNIFAVTNVGNINYLVSARANYAAEYAAALAGTTPTTNGTVTATS